ncbi:hypothetical protein SGQ44_03680 [Flavobacterium sp. Fl-77]|uniref:Uncharacterized protein n=1 Tax=Flavobacterium flavipigmentatum TaxID=2893884 RepID=A0AAJ2W086_9FLAO|nr:MULTISPECIES: hypothetical protein [unclassified Flavobacterium]MDX6181239.1 hypothetical protein [Flavobacterium sp. Fl-33]MDX6184840.1 hypothetical protein [Flavobacterium sp. Fl-77]UFH39933.1 hypothetical protein LNP22_06570 [Flavobacterium sp. F-70]
MNPKILISTLFISSLAFVSCKKELEPQENTPASELVALGLAKDTAKTKSVVEMPAGSQNVVMNSGSVNSGALNPAHGQPGHRCDISVGAPLNSAATQAQAAAPQQAPQVQVNPNQNKVVTTTTVAPVKVSKGMNPSHGQPGHRCDIPVGTPLNTPVATPAAAPPQSGTTSKTFNVTPPTANPAVPTLLSTESANKEVVTTADGMNPAHGKPGHRCDIAVGAPLPKS